LGLGFVAMLGGLPYQYIKLRWFGSISSGYFPLVVDLVTNLDFEGSITIEISTRSSEFNNFQKSLITFENHTEIPQQSLSIEPVLF